MTQFTNSHGSLPLAGGLVSPPRQTKDSKEDAESFLLCLVPDNDTTKYSLISGHDYDWTALCIQHSVLLIPLLSIPVRVPCSHVSLEDIQ